MRSNEVRRALWALHYLEDVLWDRADDVPPDAISEDVTGGNVADGTIDTTCGKSAGSWKAKPGKTESVRVTVTADKDNKCHIVAILQGANGLTIAPADAAPGSTESVAADKVAAVVFSCEGTETNDKCKGTWSVT
ncbi:MAG: hypothetical protein E6J20_04065 [Chloroflexi bacterium]|nr:MAG: hypothetical protein E6J20_04065 [Chloroflexota bacterium]